MYTNSPVFKFLPTTCCICGQPLVEAESQECGMGPICREKFAVMPATAKADAQAALAAVQALDDRDLAELLSGMVIGGNYNMAANCIARALAVWKMRGEDEVQTAHLTRALVALGFEKFAQRLGKLLGKPVVVVTEQDGMISLRTPYSAEFVEAVRKVQGRRWQAEQKVWAVPVACKREAFQVLKAHFAGMLAEGPKGLFFI